MYRKDNRTIFDLDDEEYEDYENNPDNPDITENSTEDALNMMFPDGEDD